MLYREVLLECCRKRSTETWYTLYSVDCCSYVHFYDKKRNKTGCISCFLFRRPGDTKNGGTGFLVHSKLSKYENILVLHKLLQDPSIVQVPGTGTSSRSTKVPGTNTSTKDTNLRVQVLVPGTRYQVLVLAAGPGNSVPVF